jgi:hypothetical protein
MSNTKIGMYAGDVLVSLMADGGAWENYRGPFNANKIEINDGNMEIKRRISRMRDTYGAALATAIIPQPASIGIDFDDAAADVVAMMFRSTAETLTQGSGTVTAETHAREIGRWIKLAYGNIDEGSVVVDTDAGAGLGSAYEIKYRGGFIRFLSGTGDADIDYAYSAVDGTKIRGGTKQQVRMRLHLDGRDLADNSPVELWVHDATVGPSAGQNVLATDPVLTTLSGELAVPSGGSTAYEIHYK